MARRPIAALFFLGLLLVSLTTIATQPACSEIPNKTCFGDKVNALIDIDGGSDPRTNACTGCMQRTECCDELGACGDDVACTAEFKATQRCLLEKGAGNEAECKSLLDGGKSKALYSCVRAPCGKECGIPSCDLDPAVTLFVGPACDRCVNGACCEQINACYKNRQCKLFLECITDHCPKTLGASLSGIARFAPEVLDGFERAVCDNAPVPNVQPQPQGDAFDPGACLNRCLNEFAAPDSGLPEENRASTCLAVGVYVCGAKANCGPICSAAQVAPSGSYPEDELDAGARDAGSD